MTQGARILDEPTPDLKTSSASKPARIEIKFVLWGVLGVIVLGGLYVLLAGSPTKNRALEDNTNSPPAAMYGRMPSAPPRHN
jgi:hypothetical protein